MIEFLVKQGRKVAIVDTAKEIGDGLLETLVKPHLPMQVGEKGLTMVTEVNNFTAPLDTSVLDG